MKDGDSQGLSTGEKKTTVGLERSPLLVFPNALINLLAHSLGQAPWPMDVVWYLPLGKSMRRLRDVSAAMMRKRYNDKEVGMRDLSSYLVCCSLSLK